MKVKAYFYDFSPDGGKTWYAMTDENGHRLWTSVKDRLPADVAAWRKELRCHEEDMDIGEIPDNWEDPGVWGDQGLDENSTPWEDDRAEVRIKFRSSRGGFQCSMEHDGESYLLKRPSVAGEPIWKMVGDIIRWSSDTLNSIQPLGLLFRECHTFCVSLDDDAEKSLGSEINYWRFLHGWMAKAGGDNWCS